MTQRLPDPWEHKSGYRTDADGAGITYHDPETGKQIIVEGMLNEDIGELLYAVFVLDSTRSGLENPRVRETTDGAWDVAEQMAEKHG